MNNKIISKCPSCGLNLLISELKCSDCGISITGSFQIPRVFTLPEELFDFMLIFLKNRGNIRDIERELKISYPTVRSRLDTLLNLLGLQVITGTNEILDRLEAGEITADEAERLIRRRR